MSKEVCDIWKSRSVVEALKTRDASDIWVMDCPKCGVTSYYNQGSHFSCRSCGTTFYCLSEGEEHDGSMPTVSCDEARTLTDTVGDFNQDVP